VPAASFAGALVAVDVVTSACGEEAFVSTSGAVAFGLEAADMISMQLGLERRRSKKRLATRRSRGAKAKFSKGS
jgi:hypothetical protein